MATIRSCVYWSNWPSCSFSSSDKWLVSIRTCVGYVCSLGLNGSKYSTLIIMDVIHKQIETLCKQFQFCMWFGIRNVVGRCLSQSFQFSLTSLISLFPKNLFLDSAWLFPYNRMIGVFKDKMVNKVFDGIIDKMSTLVSDNGQWTSKPGENVFIQKLNNHNNNTNVDCWCFPPLCCIINGY